jgi:hypothetical protein
MSVTRAGADNMRYPFLQRRPGGPLRWVMVRVASRFRRFGAPGVAGRPTATAHSRGTMEFPLLFTRSRGAAATAGVSATDVPRWPIIVGTGSGPAQRR